MKIQTAKLSGAALDWAVAKCEGKTNLVIQDRSPMYERSSGGDYNGRTWFESYLFSSNWAQGGPIFEREISNHQKRDGYFYCNIDAKRNQYGERSKPVWCYGETLLIAAMRCYVASKLGDEVDVPDELVK